MKYDPYYDEIASGYDSLHKSEQIKKLDLIFSQIDKEKISSNFDTLDCGCGTGICQDYLKENFQIKSTGIDPSKGLLMKNKNLCLYGYAEEMPFLDKQFDLVISLTAIQNFTDIKKGLLEIKRVGKDRFILSYLKKVLEFEEIEKMIREVFLCEFPDAKMQIIDEDKDIIFIIGF